MNPNEAPQSEASQLEAIRELLSGEAELEDVPGSDDHDDVRADGGLPEARDRGNDEAADDPLEGVDLDDLKLERDTERELSDEGETPTTLETLAEGLGIKAADLYKVAVPMPDGAEPMTLGEMKDLASTAGDVEARAAELDEHRTEFENSMIRQRQELEAIVRLLPQVPRELVERAQAAQVETLNDEREKLLRVMPSWRDDSVYQAAKADMLETVSEYGFTRSDLEAVVDHRLTKLLHDYTTLRRRVETARQKAKRVSEGQPRQGRRLSTQQQKAGKAAAATRKAKQSGKLGDQMSAVHQLLSGDS